MAPDPWPARIPAAIAKAEELLAREGGASGCVLRFGEETRNALTKTEVALAKALWKSQCPDSRTDVPGVHEVELPCPHHAALRAFCEKVEEL